MKAKMDKQLKGKKQVDGIRAQLKGRVRGRMRARKVVKTTGRLSLQNRMSRVLYKSSVLLTKYGSLGIKVHSNVIIKEKPEIPLLCEPVSPSSARAPSLRGTPKAAPRVSLKGIKPGIIANSRMRVRVPKLRDRDESKVYKGAITVPEIYPEISPKDGQKLFSNFLKKGLSALVEYKAQQYKARQREQKRDRKKGLVGTLPVKAAPLKVENFVVAPGQAFFLEGDAFRAVFGKPNRQP
jgi:hypothetical protein